MYEQLFNLCYLSDFCLGYISVRHAGRVDYTNR
jgi:hypothetical protein